MKKEVAAKAEVAMMGLVVSCASDAEVQMMTEYIIKTLEKSEQFKDLDIMRDRIRQYTKTNRVSYLTTKTIWGMPCIVYCIQNDDPEAEIPAPFSTDYGTGYPAAFTYVLNLTDDQMCSEFGDSFFKKHGNTYKCVS